MTSSECAKQVEEGLRSSGWLAYCYTSRGGIKFSKELFEIYLSFNALKVIKINSDCETMIKMDQPPTVVLSQVDSFVKLSA